jgi:hypothetical protein
VYILYCLGLAQAIGFKDKGMTHIELDNSTADRFLLGAPGLSLLVFYSQTCCQCKQAREQLPTLDLPVDRLCWIDAGHNGGLVERYEVFHLPSFSWRAMARFTARCTPALPTGTSANNLAWPWTTTPQSFPDEPNATQTLGYSGHQRHAILCLCWGFQQVLIKLVAALALGMLVWRREGSRVFSDVTLKPGLLVGSLFALEFFRGRKPDIYQRLSCVCVSVHRTHFRRSGLASELARRTFEALAMVWRVCGVWRYHHRFFRSLFN